jgi:hypothetical protein
MAVDISGGLDPRFERFLSERPANPEMRDSATLWIIDDAGEVALPRVTLDAIGSHWDEPWVQLNAAFGDGRTLRIWDRLPGYVGARVEGGLAGRGAGSLRFECLEPFRRWTLDFDGTAQASTTAAQMAGRAGGEASSLSFHFDAEMAEPPWMMGGLTAEAANAMNANGGALMGGLRYEQLCRVTGWLRNAGEERRISGTGMRVRRRGVRNMVGAPGHCQHSALFPSGRAFGANAFWPAADGSQSFNEGFVITETGERMAARLVEAPWMTRLAGVGDELPLVFETAAGRVKIEGRTLLKTFDHHHFEMADTSVLEQGVARYSWNGEETIGLFERCTLRARLADAPCPDRDGARN